MSRTIIDTKRSALKQSVDAIDAELLLSFVLEKSRTYLFTWPDHELTDHQLASYNALLKRRLAGEPIAYLIGEREFWSLPIKTDPSTLIPRPDTEVLVESVLEYFDGHSRRCIDLGTGTGAIALALKSERLNWKVEGIDRILEAVKLARSNAQRLGLDVEFNVGNWCDGLSDKSVDIIVSNPPYIDSNDPHLSKGDVRYEPRSALVARNDGLSDIEEIAEQAQRCLVEQGGLFLEHGWQQAQAVQEILMEAGFGNVETKKDYGGNERVTLGFKSK